jgi:hypothetical protein
MIERLRANMKLIGVALLACGACGGVTSSIEADGGSRDAFATHHDSGAHDGDSGTGADAAIPDHPDASVPDAGSDACPVLPPDASVQCGKPCAFPGYFSPCPPDLGNPIGVSCRAIVDGGGPIWFCSEG